MKELWYMAGDGLMWLLAWIHGLTNSWGLAIIGVTFLVRLVMHPLTRKQMSSMKKMQELQPRMKVFQEKYADDKEMQSKKIMELYKENKVNPASGCFPLLIQLPIFILLYGVLTRHGFADASFLTIHLDGSVISTIADAINLVDPVTLEKIPIKVLDAAAGYYVFNPQLGVVMVMFSAMTNLSLLFANLGTWLPNTVLLMVISFLTWYQQRLSSVGNPNMAMMNWFMPVFLTFICLKLPGGVLLYWGVSSLMGVVSQIFTMRKTSVEMSKKPVLLQEKPTQKDT